jgi:hypothetical protein
MSTQGMLCFEGHRYLKVNIGHFPLIGAPQISNELLFAGETVNISNSLNVYFVCRTDLNQSEPTRPL